MFLLATWRFGLNPLSWFGWCRCQPLSFIHHRPPSSSSVIATINTKLVQILEHVYMITLTFPSNLGGDFVVVISGRFCRDSENVVRALSCSHSMEMWPSCRIAPPVMHQMMKVCPGMAWTEGPLNGWTRTFEDSLLLSVSLLAATRRWITRFVSRLSDRLSYIRKIGYLCKEKASGYLCSEHNHVYTSNKQPSVYHSVCIPSIYHSAFPHPCLYFQS